MAKKNKTYEDIPDMIEQCLTIQQQELDRLEKLPKLETADIRNCINMMSSLNSIYITYRLMKKEIKKEVRSYSPQVIQSLKDQVAKTNN